MEFDFTVAVCADGSNLSLVHLEADCGESTAATTVARGYEFCGTIAVIKGEPMVAIEPGHAGDIARAGIVFAGMLGPFLKSRQLEALELQDAAYGAKAEA